MVDWPPLPEEKRENLEVASNPVPDRPQKPLKLVI
jgi:hypothetical protein